MPDLLAKRTGLRADFAKSERKTSARASSLPAMPHFTDDEIHFEPFQVPGLDPVDVLRPKRDEFRPAREDAPALVLVPGLGMDCRGYIRQFPLGSIADIHMIQAH